MKRLLYILPFLPVLFSCENISEDDRYIEVEPIHSQRRVLLEEFTGQRCTNCPAAHAIIEQLEEQYGEDLVVVSIHAGSFGIAAPAGLMQPEGNEYAEHWHITAYPCGIVDRNTDVLTDDKWAAAIRNEIGKEAYVDIELTASVSESGETIDITTLISSSKQAAPALQLWVTEDSIVGFQIDGSQRLQDYVHNNVYRGSVNGLWGQTVNLTPNVYTNIDSSIAIDKTWDTNHLNVVGFLYDDSGVIQAAKCKVINN